jgi:hypothetical protein
LHDAALAEKFPAALMPRLAVAPAAACTLKAGWIEPHPQLLGRASEADVTRAKDAMAAIEEDAVTLQEDLADVERRQGVLGPARLQIVSEYRQKMARADRDEVHASIRTLRDTIDKGQDVARSAMRQADHIEAAYTVVDARGNPGLAPECLIDQAELELVRQIYRVLDAGTGPIEGGIMNDWRKEADRVLARDLEAERASVRGVADG